jgi:hypothetical protein
MGMATAVTETWGGDFKRIDVPFPTGDKSRQFTDSTGLVRNLIEDDVRSQKLIEVANQAATIERLKDALSWAMSAQSGLSEYRIRLCHPTTSSEKSKKKDHKDHDLVLESPLTEATAIFEVSDVASSRDGNDKAAKDLRSLGVLEEGTGEAKFSRRDWPAGPADRLFLVVSCEWIAPLTNAKKEWQIERTVDDREIPPHLVLDRIPWSSPTTGIFEIRPGPGFGKSPKSPPLDQDSTNS